MNASVANQKARRNLHRKVFERIKELKWRTSYASHIPFSKLVRTLFFVESTNNNN